MNIFLVIPFHILLDINNTFLSSGQQFAQEEFVPIGNFFILEPATMSPLLTKSTSPQIQEAILKEPIRIIENWKDIKLGHSLKDFYCPTLTKLLQLTSVMNRSIEDQNMLKPTLATDDCPPTLFLKQNVDDEFSCTLIARGNFLENIQMHRPVRYLIL